MNYCKYKTAKISLQHKLFDFSLELNYILTLAVGDFFCPPRRHIHKIGLTYRHSRGLSSFSIVEFE